MKDNGAETESEEWVLLGQAFEGGKNTKENISGSQKTTDDFYAIKFYEKCFLRLCDICTIVKQLQSH